VAAGAPIRAMYRNKEDAAKAPAGVETVIADFATPASLQGALRGIDTVFLVCGPVPQLVQLESNMIDACKQAGVRHIVLNSAFGAGDFAKSFPSWHFQVEQKLHDSGIAHAILRPNGFLQNIATYLAGTIRTQNAFYSTIGDAQISLIDVRDVGAVAAKILQEPRAHAGKIYELHGSEAVSNKVIAERVSRIVGRKISYVNISEDAMRKAMLDLGMPEVFVDAELELEGYYRTGRCAVVDGLVARLLGRPECTLDAYLRENLSAFQSQAATA
jgi:uncharacterized protein YbjT (DUF2867 family)